MDQPLQDLKSCLWINLGYYNVLYQESVASPFLQWTGLLRNMITITIYTILQPRPQYNYCRQGFNFVYFILNIFSKEFLLTDLDRLFLGGPTSDSRD